MARIVMLFIRPQHMGSARPVDRYRGLVPAIQKECDDIMRHVQCFGNPIEQTCAFIDGASVKITSFGGTMLHVEFYGSGSGQAFAKAEVR